MKEKLAELIQELHSALERLSKDPDYDHVIPKAGTPASPEEIKALEAQFGRSLPDSYRAFLELHNGYDFLAYPGPMLSVQQLQAGSEWDQRIQNWKKDTARYDQPELLDALVVGNLGSSNQWVYLDPNRPSKKNELTVVDFDPEQSDDYPSLLELSLIHI